LKEPANSGRILSADEISNDAAVVYAATSTPALVFVGLVGAARLDAGALANGYSK
jgi:hypothetical protein